VETRVELAKAPETARPIGKATVNAIFIARPWFTPAKILMLFGGAKGQR
jgi:hypothetical protein